MPTASTVAVHARKCLKEAHIRFGSGFSAKRRDAAPTGRRRANLGAGYGDTDLHRGPDLAAGDVVSAPAIIEETFTTIVVYPGWRAAVDDAGDYLLTRTD